MRLTRESSLYAWRTWRGRPVVVVKNLVWVNRAPIIARGDVLIRPWGACFVGCTWQRLPAGTERVVFPGRAGENGPVPVFAFENQAIARRFQSAAREAFHRAAAANPPPNIEFLRPPAKPAKSAALVGDGSPRIPKVSLGEP